MPVKHLTARNVAAWKPEPGRSVRDKLSGLELRVTGSGQKVWSVRYRAYGKQRRWTIGHFPLISLADAREAARRVVREVELGTDPREREKAERIKREMEARRLTVGSLTDQYLDRHAKPRKRTWKTDKRLLNSYVLPRWKSRLACDIARRDVRELIEAIADGSGSRNGGKRPAPYVANRVLEVIRGMFNWALKQEHVEVNPAARIDKPGVERSRERVLSDDEIRQLWAALESQPAAMEAAFKLRLLTAQRGGEVHSMRWQDVDLDAGWWTIPAESSKNGLAHRVPFTAPALRILKSLCLQDGEKHDSPYVLAGARGKRQRSAAAKEIGLPDFIGHDLRRTAASRMASAGVSRFVIARVLNHVDGGVTAVYDRHSYDAEKRVALERWAQSLETILAPLAAKSA